MAEVQKAPSNTTQVPIANNSQDQGPVSPEKVDVIIVDNQKILNNDNKVHYTFVLLVNSGSGDSKAALLTKLDVERIVFSNFNPRDAEVEILIFALNNFTSRTNGLKKIKSLQESNLTNIRVIVGGGDGSIMWAVQEMINSNVAFEKCVIGTIPFGTGNDFSRVMGWGPTEPKVLLGPHLNNFKGMISKWVDANVQSFDVWEITIETYENGGLKQIQREAGKFQKKFMSILDLETGKEVPLNSFRKLMCNYFSFGVDSRIGYGFDKGRTKSRLKNKCVYGWEGFKKLLTKTPRLNDVVESVHNDKKDVKIQELERKEARGQEVEVKADEVEFTADDFLMYPYVHLEKARNDGKAHVNVSVIKGNPSVFLCLNIPSYMGGASDPWRSARGKLGAHGHDKSKLTDFADQSYGDGKLEILSFGGPLSMAAERLIPGQGRRLGQAKGPFVINFKQGEKDGKPIHTYMQIDGEFYDVVAPKRVRICLCPRLPSGKIQVMVNSNKK